MSALSHLKCRYCGILFPVSFTPTTAIPLRHDKHPHGCATPLEEFDEQAPTKSPCYTCGLIDDSDNITISVSQRQKHGGAARCNTCVTNRITDRAALPEEPATLGALLTDAVQTHNLDTVKQLLNAGANPDYIRQRTYFEPGVNKEVKLWFANGQPEPDLEPNQPTTPLKLVQFRISDCTLSQTDIAAFHAIEKVLLAAGADPLPASEYRNMRYGTAP
eukprot:m.22793 g.22793  ORF g.22793 m.22793 type:complete len:218 (-) comp13953_c0_seq1:86-739(-)